MDSNDFRFKTKLDQTVLLGKKARNVSELLEGIKTVPESSIYYHTHKFLQQHHFLSPEPPNDFAYWVTSILNESALGERIWSVDIIQFHKISELRATFIEILEKFLASTNRSVDAPEGEEFHFMSSKTFVLETPYVARTLDEFVHHLRNISIHSLYYHIFDAHLRLEHEENDFSVWFRRLGKTRLSDAVKKLDPYTQTLDGLQRKIIQLVETHGKD